MALWAGIDEAGYGPLLGPLVAAGTVFSVRGTPREGALWPLLSDAVSRRFKAADGRLVIDDSKRVYNRKRGIRPLEEGVLSFMGTLCRTPASTGELLTSLLPAGADCHDGTPWASGISELPLPRRSNPAALASKITDLQRAFADSGVRFMATRAVAVLPAEFNRHVRATGNKASLLLQRCGMLLQGLRQAAAGEDIYVLVDRHGGRRRYRSLLTDTFPDCSCDIIREDTEGSVYRVCNAAQKIVIAFKSEADSRALPVALASMTAKYIRELYMECFNAYWLGRVEGLSPTAGYARDGRRFLDDIAHLLDSEEVDSGSLVRLC